MWHGNYFRNITERSQKSIFDRTMIYDTLKYDQKITACISRAGVKQMLVGHVVVNRIYNGYMVIMVVAMITEPLDFGPVIYPLQNVADRFL